MHESNASTTLVADLADRGLISDREAARRALARASVEGSLPVYARILAGLGALIAAFCLLAALALAELFDLDSPAALFGIGFPLAALALPLRHAGLGAPGSVISSFLLQLSLLAMAAGKVLCVISVAVVLDTSWGLALGAMLATALTYPTYRSPVDRFASTYATIVLVSALIVWHVDHSVMREAAFHAIGAACLAGSGLALLWPRAVGAMRPAAYALVLGLVTYVLVVTVPHDLLGGQTLESVSRWPPRLVFAALAATAGVLVAGVVPRQHLPLDAAVAGITGAVAVALVADPGITLALGLLGFGHWRRERALVVGGLLLLPASLWFYYYSLDLDLASKSAVLVSSGLVLLAGRVYLAQRIEEDPA